MTWKNKTYICILLIIPTIGSVGCEDQNKQSLQDYTEPDFNYSISENRRPEFPSILTITAPNELKKNTSIVELPISVQGSKMEGPGNRKEKVSTIFKSSPHIPTLKKSLLLYTSFENREFLKAWRWTENPKSGYIKQSTEQVRSGKYSGKFELNKTDLDIGGSKRLEMAREPYQTPGGEHWYGMSINLPTSYIADPNEEILFQLHQTSDSGDGSISPPIALQTKDGRWRMQILWDSRAANTDQNWSNLKIIDLGAYTTGAWTDWVFHIKSSYQTDGLIEIWKNGKLAATYQGPNNYNDKLGNFLKMGIYKWGWKEGIYSTTKKRIVYFDEIRIGDKNSSYSEVAP